MSRFQNFTELRASVEERGGILAVSMADVRDAGEAKRLRGNVRERLERALQNEGLGHLPPEPLPNDQNKDIRVYSRNSDLGEIVEAVLLPTDVGDERLRAAAGSEAGQAVEQLEAIREILDEAA